MKRLYVLVALTALAGFSLALAQPETLAREGWTPAWTAAFVLLAPVMLGCAAVALALLAFSVYVLVTGKLPGEEDQKPDTKKYAARARRVNALEEYDRTGDERWYPYDN